MQPNTLQYIVVTEGRIYAVQVDLLADEVRFAEHVLERHF